MHLNDYKKNKSNLDKVIHVYLYKFFCETFSFIMYRDERKNPE